MSIGRNIAYTRTMRGFTQEEIAKKLGVSISFISKLEGNRNTPSVKRLIQIADILGVSLDYLAGREKFYKKEF